MTSSALAPEIACGGFNFSNVQRNVSLVSSGFPEPKTTKTGTTIVGCLFENGVVLGADTRATSGNIVADKNCSKIHRITDRIFCCGAGTAADTEMTTRKIESQLELLRLNLGRDVPVVVANRLIKQLLFRHQGHISAALVLGGVDNSGSYIFCIYPHGSTDKLPYATMGSGSLAAMSVFELGWKENMSREEAIQLVRDAIAAGIKNDLGSGSNVDINIIHKDQRKVEILRTHEVIGVRGERQGDYTYPTGTTKVLKTEVIPIKVEEVVVESMDTSD